MILRRSFALGLVGMLAASSCSFGESIETLVPQGINAETSDRWMLGCECLDRDYADFARYRDYIPRLGIARIRLQAGWFRCERQKGVYDFTWLDEIVDWARAHGIAVTLDLSYGNALYEGGGSQGLAGAIPSGAIGLAAWDRWVETLATHYRTRVDDYLMWNEPDTHRAHNTPEAIGAFNARTARILRRVVPAAHLSALQLAHHGPELLDRCLAGMGEDVKLFDSVCFHEYGVNPDSHYALVGPKLDVLKRRAPHLVLRDTEAGCISAWSEKFAMKRVAWTELSQAKWDLRRMLGDASRGIRSSVFTICDLRYRGVIDCMNRKGLLCANDAHEVLGEKKAYGAVRNAVALFNRRAVLAPDLTFEAGRTDVSVFAWRRSGSPLAVYWSHPPLTDAKTKPTESLEKELVTLTFKGAPLEDPVWVDPLDGTVHPLAADAISSTAAGTLYRVPLYDAPLLLTERRALADLCSRNVCACICSRQCAIIRAWSQR